MTTMTSPQPVSAGRPPRTRRPARSINAPLAPGTTWALRLASVVAILAGWEAYGRAVNPVLLSSPSAIAVAFVRMVADGTLPHALGESLVVLGMGSLIGVAVGLGVGLAAGRNRVLAALIELPLNALYATPSVALIPVIVVWFGFGPTAKTVVVILFVLFPVLINTMRGVQEVDRELVEVARSFCSGERRMWFDLILPSALPYVVTGLRLAIGRALIGVIVAEFFTAFAGLGHLIVTNANSFRTDRTFVPILVIAVFGVLLTALLELVERRIVRWSAKD
ncbi:ABC transporter permease [Pseudonocardia acaciae]|uniref:ABC transporter permease n=1 Tax=Pseudonocardia acaciae TaxID=551276 RepID=UPI0006868C82|nr:ABC transporter permease [Pseudonocardia acaciae]